MSNLSDLLPSGAGGKQVDFVASGAIGNGKTVILNSNGTVTAVAGSTVVGSVTSPVNYATVEAAQMRSAYDTANNKVIICYRQYVGGVGSSLAVVGTVSSGSITFGTPVTIGTSITDPYPTFATTSGKVFISYKTSSALSGVVGTVSGTSISFGSAVTIFSGVNNYSVSTYDSANDKIVVAWSNSSTNAQARVGTISGTSISFGSAVVFSSSNANYHAICYDSTNEKIVIASNVGSIGKAVVGTVSGTSISFGGAVNYSATDPQYQAVAYDVAKERVLISWRSPDNSMLYSIVGEVSGASISYGSAATFGYHGGDLMTSVYNTALKKIVIGYKSTSSYPATRTVEITGSSATMSTPIVIQSSASNVAIVYDPDSNTINVATNTNSTGRSYLQTLAAVITNLTTTNFIGVTDAAIANSATGSVTIKGGTTTNLSSLTVNSVYYVQNDGSISTVTTAPAVRIGRALSSTSINLEFTA